MSDIDRDQIIGHLDTLFASHSPDIRKLFKSLRKESARSFIELLEEVSWPSIDVMIGQ